MWFDWLIGTRTSPGFPSSILSHLACTRRYVLGYRVLQLGGGLAAHSSVPSPRRGKEFKTSWGNNRTRSRGFDCYRSCLPGELSGFWCRVVDPRSKRKREREKAVLRGLYCCTCRKRRPKAQPGMTTLIITLSLVGSLIHPYCKRWGVGYGRS